MKIELRPLELSALDALRCEVLMVPYFADEKPLRGLGALIDWRQHGKISNMQLDALMTGGSGEKTWVALERPLRVPKAIFFGLGKSSASFGADQLQSACAALAQTLSQGDLRAIALSLPGRSTHQVGAQDAMQAWLQALNSSNALLDLIIFDELSEHGQLRHAINAQRARV